MTHTRMKICRDTLMACPFNNRVMQREQQTTDKWSHKTNEESAREKSAIVKAHVGVLFTNIFFAGNYSVVKSISPAFLGPSALNVMRAGIAVVLFWTAWLLGKTGVGIQKKHWGRFLLCGLTGVCINQLLFIKGLTQTTTIHAARLTLVTPNAVTLFALWILKERFTLAKALGLALGIGGATFLILQREASQHATNYLLGDMLIVINAIAYSIYFILVKPLMKEYSTLHVTRWVFTLGFLMLLPFGAVLAGNKSSHCFMLLCWEHF